MEEVVNVTQNETKKDISLYDLESDNILILARQADERIAAIKKIMTAALAVTHESDWVLIGGKPYLQETGATKIARLFGVSWRIAEPTIIVDDKGYKTFIFKGTFRLNNDEIEAEGSRNMREDFFSSSKGDIKTPDEVDERDVRMSAYTNCINNGIKRLIPGIRNMGVSALEEAGLDINKIKGYTFKEGSKGGKSKSTVDDGLKCSDCGESVTQTVASYSQAKFGRILCMKCQKAQQEPSKQAVEGDK